MKNKLKLLGRLFLCVSLVNTGMVYSLPLDPCSDAEFRYWCLLGLVKQEVDAINARIAFLSSTPGPQGEQGPTGERGEPGDPGDPGEDRESFIVDGIAQRLDEMDERYRGIGSDFNDYIIPLINDFQTDVDDLRRRFSDVNRNPDIIAASSLDRPSTLDFPTYIGESDARYYFKGFDVQRKDGSEFCEVRFQYDTVTTACESNVISGTFEIVNVCQDTFPAEPDYCGQVIDSDTLAAITINELDIEINLDAFVDLPEETPFQIVSMDEWSSYKLGMDADDPVFLLALDNILAKLADDEILQNILDGLAAAPIEAEAQATARRQFLEEQIALLTQTGDPLGQIPALQALIDEIDENLVRFIAAYDEGAKLTLSLVGSDETYGMKRQRLAEYAMDSDMMYFVLVHSVIDVYLNYLFDPTYATYLTQEQLDAMEDFEARLLYFTQNYIKKWQDEARAERDRFFQEQIDFPFYEVYTLPTTPDFVETAGEKVASSYDTKQSADVQSYWKVASDVGSSALVFGAFPAMFAAGAVAASSISTAIAAAGTTTGFGLYSAFGGAGFAALGGTAGVAGVIAGPALVLTLAIVGIVAGSIAVDDQLKKDARYEALQALEVTDMDFFRIIPDPEAKEKLANLMYLWLMVSNPRGVSNNSNY